MKWLKGILPLKPSKEASAAAGMSKGHTIKSLFGSFTGKKRAAGQSGIIHAIPHQAGDPPDSDSVSSQPAPLPATKWLLQLASSTSMPTVLFSSLAARFAHRTEPVSILLVGRTQQSDPAVFAANVALVSSGLRAMLNITSNEDYNKFISLLDQAEPHFTSALREAGARAKAACCSDGLLSEHSTNTTWLNITLPNGTLRLAITPFIIKAASKAQSRQAALLIEHSLYQQELFLHQLLQQRDLLLGQTDTMLTLCDMKGRVLHQNTAALNFAGNRISVPFTNCGPRVRAPDAMDSSYLKDLLQLEPELLEDLLEEVGTEGGQWNAVVRVPSTLNTRAAGGVASHRLAYSSSCMDTTAGAFLDSNKGSLGKNGMVESLEGPTVCSMLHSAVASTDLGLEADLLTSETNLQGAWPSLPTAGIQKTLSTRNPAALASKAVFLATAPDGLDAAIDGPGTELDVKPGGTKRGRGLIKRASRLHALMDTGVATGPLSCGNTAGSASAPGGANEAIWQDRKSYARQASTLGNQDACREQTGTSTSSNAQFGVNDAGQNHQMVWPPKADTRSNHATAMHQALLRDDVSGLSNHTASWTDPEQACWHQITVSPVVDPDTGDTLLVVSQNDVSRRVEHEDETTQVSDACVQLLELIFPRHVLEHLTLKQGAKTLASRAPDVPAESQETNMIDQMATRHACVTLFFCDIVGFTTMSKEVDPVIVMKFLNALYTRYDELADMYGVYKVETVGDCYVVAGGLMEQDKDGFAVVNTEGVNGPEHALAVYQFAQAVLDVARNTVMPHNNQPVQVRIGLHSGPITAGVVGYRMPKFCLFGDTMNTASRMETTCSYGCIHMSDATYALLDMANAAQDLVCTGGVEVKGKGLMTTYMYQPDTVAPINCPVLPSVVPVAASSLPPLASAMVALQRSSTFNRVRSDEFRSAEFPSSPSSSHLNSNQPRSVGSRTGLAEAAIAKASDTAGAKAASPMPPTTSLTSSVTDEILKALSERVPGHLSVPSVPGAPTSPASHSAVHGSQVGKPGSRLKSSQTVSVMDDIVLGTTSDVARAASREPLGQVTVEDDNSSWDLSTGSPLFQEQFRHESRRGDHALLSSARFLETDNPTFSGSNLGESARSTACRIVSGDMAMPLRNSVRGKSPDFALNSGNNWNSPQAGAQPQLMSLVSTLQRVGTLQRLASIRRPMAAAHRASIGERPGSIHSSVRASIAGQKPGSGTVGADGAGRGGDGVLGPSIPSVLRSYAS